MLKRFSGLDVSTLWMTLASTCRTGACREMGMVTAGTARKDRADTGKQSEEEILAVVCDMMAKKESTPCLGRCDLAD